MTNLKSAALLMLSVVLGLGSASIQAAPGDQLPWLNASFVDKESRVTYQIGIGANESQTEPGVGNGSFSVWGPRLSLRTMHSVSIAARETIDYSTNPPTIVTHSPPLDIPLWEQGGAGNQAVNISAQVVEFSAHSFVHSDAPNIVFLGPVTADIRIERNSREIQVVIFTPKGKIKLEGHLSVTP